MRLARKSSSHPGSLAFEPQGGLAGSQSDQVLRHVLDSAQVGREVIGSHAAFVVAEHHVQGSAQTVLDRPVAAYDRRQRAGHEHE
jgi:hypothetical protein